MKLSWSSLGIAAWLWSAFAIALASSQPSPLTEPAAINDASPTDTFTYTENGLNFTFTITANANGDIWFSMAAPAMYGWFAVGTGSQMAGSLMFVAYRDSTPTGITLSPRFSSGHVEPTYSDTIQLSKVSPPNGPANVYQDGMNFVSGTCTNCTNLAPNKLDLTNTAQPFIFALGEAGRSPATTSLSGPLRRHAYYGFFTMDMTKATDSGGDDSISLHDTMENAQLTGKGVVMDHDFADPGHAFVMVLAWLIIFPLGVLSLRVLKSVKLHMTFQTIGLVLGLIGAASGFYLTAIYNRSKHFNTAHQIIGLLLVIALIGQWIGGFLHHRYYVRNQRPWMNGTPIKGHKLILGPIILLVGLVNVAIGFILAVAHQWNYVYIPLAIVMVIAFSAIIFVRDALSRRFEGRKKRPIISPPQPMPFGMQPPPAGPGGFYGQGAAPSFVASTRSDIALDRLPSHDPPSYSAEPVKPRDMI